MNKKPGRPTNHGERKRQRNISVTDTAWRGIKKLAESCKVSISEYLEQLGRLGDTQETED